MKKLIFISFLLIQQFLYGNNLQLSDLQLNNGKLSFTISWENSWNIEESPSNHDAVWIFIKVKQNNIYSHFDINTNNDQFSINPEILEILIPSDKKGLLIKRKDLGKGNIVHTKIEFPFNITQEDLQSVKIFGIEMVYISKGEFYFGDGISYNSIMNNDSTSLFIENEDELNLIDREVICIEDSLLPQNLPAEYPKGYAGFYCVKYELSQQQYCEFLNTLTTDQQTSLTENSPFSAQGTFAMIANGRNRNAIAIARSASTFPALYALDLNRNGIYNEIDDGANLATDWLNWSDLAAYLDWAALRPMTEMEFEKICRGNQNPIKGEFAWGTPYIYDANTIQNAGQENEFVVETGNDSVGLANHGYDGIQGPLRCGFPATVASDRITSGSSFYGVMEMSGNLWEQVISISDEGVLFSGNHGDGELVSNGNANVLNWPDNNDAKGIGFKGGGWNSGIYEIGSFRDLAVSDRFYINWNPSLRRSTTGGRGVRTFNIE